MKILLVQTPNVPGQFFSLPGKEIPLAFCYMAAYLKRQGFDDVRILDLDFHGRVSPHLEDTLADFRPDLVGVTSYTTNVAIAGRIAETVKTTLPDAVTVIGGFHASALPERTLREFPGFDYLVFGEGEITFTEMASAIDGDGDLTAIDGVAWREGDEVALGNPRPLIDPLDDLPLPDRSLVPVLEYIPDPGNYFRLPSTGILFSRGCPFRCTYCSKSVFFHSIRYREVGSFLDEVEECDRRFGIRDFRLEDEGPTANVKKMKALCEGILSRGLSITWNCFSRLDTVDRELLALMERAGCYHVTYGLESANRETLDRVRKKIDLARAEQVIRWTRELGIECKVNFIFGFPWETLEKMKNTIRYARRLSPDLVTFNIFKPYPGSTLYVEMERDGRLRHTKWEDYFGTSETLLFEAPFTESDLHRLIRSAIIGFYFRPRFILQRLLRLARSPGREASTLWRGLAVLVREVMNMARAKAR